LLPHFQGKKYPGFGIMDMAELPSLA